MEKIITSAPAMPEDLQKLLYKWESMTLSATPRNIDGTTVSSDENENTLRELYTLGDHELTEPEAFMHFLALQLIGANQQGDTDHSRTMIEFSEKFTYCALGAIFDNGRSVYNGVIDYNLSNILTSGMVKLTREIAKVMNDGNPEMTAQNRTDISRAFGGFIAEFFAAFYTEVTVPAYREVMGRSEDHSEEELSEISESLAYTEYLMDNSSRLMPVTYQ